MDLTRLMEILFRRVLMRLARRGLGAGIDHVTGKGGTSRKGARPPSSAPASEARAMQQRARRAARLTRWF